MKYRLIATDMDGTLLNSYSEISKENKESIIKVQEEGVVFVLASGRPTFGMIKASKELEMGKFGGYISSYGGGEIFDCKSGEVICRMGLEKQEVIDMYNYAINNELTFLTYNDDTIYTSDINEYAMTEVKFVGGNIKKINDINEIDFSKVIKCMLVGQEHITKKHVEILKNSKYSNKLFFAISVPIFIEVVNKDVDKGKTLNKLLDKLNISNKDIIGVGDSYNDIPLLEVSGLKVVPSNAKKELKDMADYVGVSNDEHILKDLIEKYVLK